MSRQHLGLTTQFPSQGMGWPGQRFIHLPSESPWVGIEPRSPAQQSKFMTTIPRRHVIMRAGPVYTGLFVYRVLVRLIPHFWHFIFGCTLYTGIVVSFTKHNNRMFQIQGGRLFWKFWKRGEGRLFEGAFKRRGGGVKSKYDKNEEKRVLF